MININLLPTHLRPIKRTPLPYLICALLFGVSMLGIAGSYLASHASIRSQQNQLIANRATLNDPQLQSIVDESNRLEALKTRLDRRKAIIEEIVSDQIIWSKRLWQLSALAPDNVWYSNIREDKKKYTEEVMEPDPQTGQPRYVSKSVERPILRVEGYVVPGPDGMASVTPLTDHLTSPTDLTLPAELRSSDDPDVQKNAFSQQFQLDSPTFEDASFEGFSAKKFELEFVINRAGSAS